MSRAKYAYVVILLQYALAKIGGVSISARQGAKNLKLIVSYSAPENNRFTFEIFLPPPPQ